MIKINVLFVSVTLLFIVHAVQAQDTATRWHKVRGIVVDKIGRPAAGATVFLKDVGGHRLRMKQTDRDGRFSFGLVNLDEKYEIYAEQQSFISQKLPVTAVHSQHDIVVKLELRNGVG